MPFLAFRSARNMEDAAGSTNIRPSSIIARFTPEVLAYVSALVLLFYTNLQQHAHGSVFWDLDVGGAVHSILLSLMVYENCKDTLYDKLGLPQIPTFVTRTTAVVATAVELATPLMPHDVGRKVASTVGAVAALTVVPFMGYLSWIQRRVDGHRAFGLWILSCVGVKGAQWLVKVEQAFCENNNGGTAMPAWILRFFHATVIHAEIWMLFAAVSECAFAIIRHNRLLNNDAKKK